MANMKWPFSIDFDCGEKGGMAGGGKEFKVSGLVSSGPMN